MYRMALTSWPLTSLILTGSYGLGLYLLVHSQRAIAAEVDFDLSRSSIAMMFVWPVVLMGSLVILVVSYFLFIWPMRQERHRIAAQLSAFDVCNCNATVETDKALVLDLIGRMFSNSAGTERGEGGGHREAALARFNELVRTRVAHRLWRMGVAQEATMALFLLLVLIFLFLYLSV